MKKIREILLLSGIALLIGISLILFKIAVIALLVWCIWNWLLSGWLGLPGISYMQAFGGLLILRLLKTALSHLFTTQKD